MIATFPPVLIMTPSAYLRRGHATGPALILVSGGYVIARWRSRVILPTQQWLVAVHILTRAGGLAGHQDLVDLLWSADPEGGPLRAKRVAGYLVSRARADLDRIGIGITTVWGQGFRAVDLTAQHRVAA